MLKTIFYIMVFAIMIYALIDQANTQPKIWLQIVAVILFFGTMMQLMNRTPSNNKNKENEKE